MKKIAIIILFFILQSTVFGQKYPIPVRPGETLTITGIKTNIILPLKDDTLWVMKNSQLQNAIIKAKKLEICEEQISEYKNQTALHKQKDQTQDSLLNIMTKDRDYYMNTWKTCDQDIQKLGRMQKRQKLYTKLAIIAIPVSFVIGLFVTKL
jgi:hypothetical protein